MHPLAHDDISTSAELWARLVAGGQITTALGALEEAGAALVRLVDDTDWQSAGFRALHEVLARLREDTGVEVGLLTARQWELAPVV